MLKYRDSADRVADFQSLRHTCGSWLAAAGVHPKVIQRIMRHSTITLTMDRYTHLFKGDEAVAVAKLPSLSLSMSGQVKATGTDGTPHDRDDLPGKVRGAQRGAQGELNSPGTRTQTHYNGPERGFDLAGVAELADATDSKSDFGIT